MAEAAKPKTMEELQDDAKLRPLLIHEEERADNSTPQISVADSNSSKTPQSLQVHAQQAGKMDSDTDFSDFECNTFAKRVLHSPRIGMKKDPPSHIFGLTSSNQSTSEPWEQESRKQNHSMNLGLEPNSHMDSEHISAHFISKSQPQHSKMSETSSYDSNTDTDSASDTSSSPLRSGLIGTYGKLAADGKTSLSETYSDGSVDELVLSRLPGENLGLVFAVEGGRLSREPISSVFVKEVDENGVAFRKGIRVGDKILEINGIILNRLSHDECVSVIQEMPLQILLHIKRVRQQKKLTFKQKLQAREKKFNAQWEIMGKEFEKSEYLADSSIDKRPNSNGVNTSMVFSSDGDDSDFEEGFTVHEVHLQKSSSESLGLSVVPSYGATRNLYQVTSYISSSHVVLSV
ncbi:partitioning defective 3 homolog [Gigantopelta aegis]|uniref:partitioning defective 3 homolog n=1 Tax=Gigantopelta aegis TaxID=1735272 RepID=UPI001B88C74C|nr:partitioning defective 3 homolog [Gigantopelta aegis]